MTDSSFFQSVLNQPKRFFFCLFGLACLLRLSTFFYTFLDIDESQFAGFAHTLMEGGLPYRDSLDTKPLLIYLYYWAAFSIFGKYSMTGVHLVSLIWHCTTVWLIYRIGLEHRQKMAGLLGAFFYVIFSTTYFPKFISTSITSVMILPLTAAIYFWLKGENTRNAPYDFLAGLCCGLAFLCKYQAGIQIVVIFAYLVPFALQQRERALTYLRRYLMFSFGFAVPIAIFLLSLHQLGVLNDFYQWSVQGSAHYIQAGNQTISYAHNLLTKGGPFILATFFLWFWLARHVVGYWLTPFTCREVLNKLTRNPLVTLTWLWLVFSLVPVATGGRFYGHYFIQILPPLCLIAGLELTRRLKLQPESAWQSLSTRRRFKTWLLLGICLPTFVFWFLRLDLRRIDRLFPDDQLFAQQEIGLWLKQHSKPGETLFVWGFATAIYFHAERSAASRFLWTDLLTGKVPGSELATQTEFSTSHLARPEAWAAFWQDMQETPPTYFVDTAPANIHSYGKYPLNHYPELMAFLSENFEPWQTIGGAVIYRARGR